MRAIFTGCCGIHLAERIDTRWIINSSSTPCAGSRRLAQRYTRSEAGRILGVEPSRLRYWERLRLVRPYARWGERFYGFGDLIALRTIQQLVAQHVPARWLRRAVSSLEQQFGARELPLQELTVIGSGRRTAVREN